MRILRGLTSRLLPCGCMAGVYETYDGKVVTLIDERQATCPRSRHMFPQRIPGSDSPTCRQREVGWRLLR